MARLISVDDKGWLEVQTINSYAIFMGYLLMGVRGLGLLVLTWTTVVLLGGFVSMLQTKDFWCLTVITLVQTAGVIDFLLKEKAGDIRISLQGMISALIAVVGRALKKDKGTSDAKAEEDEDPSNARIVLAFVLFVVALLVQLLVLAVVLCVVAVLYLLGLYVSAGISLWRLIELDYGSNAEGGANLKPALNVLYSIAVAQGVVFGYKNIYDYVAKAELLQDVASVYSMDTTLVNDYLDETVTGCMKDPSFARGRNLVTYAVDLLMEKSKSRHGYLSGVRILGAIIILARWNSGQKVVINDLLTGSASFGHVIQRLVETFGPTRSPYSGEIRAHAARIVALVAGSIRLEEQFPGGTMIQCISSLLDSFEEYSWRPDDGYERDNDLPKEYERDWLLEEHERDSSAYKQDHSSSVSREGDSNKSPESDSSDLLQGYNELVVQGLRILQKLAIHESNCRVISNTQGLLAKAMTPLISEQLHCDCHDEWSSIAEESLELMSRLMAAPGDTGSELRSEISGRCQATIANILECGKCQVFLKRLAAKVLLDLPGDMPSSGRNSTIFSGLLLHIFVLPDYGFGPGVPWLKGQGTYYSKMRGSTHLAKRSSYITRLAGEKLQCVVLSLQNQAGAKSMSLQSSVAAAIADLTRTSVDAAVNITYRLHVVQILEDLCRWYPKDGQYLLELKNAMADVMPKILKGILVGCASTSAEIHERTEADNDQVSAQRTDDDIEEGVVPPGNGQEDASSSQQQSADEQHEGIRLQEALVSLCKAIPWRWHREFDHLAEKTCLQQGISIPHKDFMSLVRYAEDLVKQLKKARGLATED